MASSNDTSISLSLLKNVQVGAVSPRFSLGMDDWILDSEPVRSASSGSRARKHHPTSQLHPLPTKKHAPQPCPPQPTRFSTASKEELATLAKPYAPKKTEDSTQWAVRNLTTWMQHRNTSQSGDKCPEDLLQTMDPQQLNHWLSVFVVETRKVNGEPYPPATLHNILSGILRYMRTLDAKCPNILNKDDPYFKTLSNTMDSLFRKLRKEGFGCDKKHAKPFTKEEEEQLWATGAIGVSDPLSLLRAVFYYNGKNFCLRGGSEHRELKLSQLRRVRDGYIYTENSSKKSSQWTCSVKVGE